MTSFCPRSFRLLFIGLLAACFVSHQILAQQLSMSLAVSVNGQKVDFSGASDLALALYGSDKQELSLMTGVPPTLQDKLPDGLALALKKETVKDLKAELQAAKDAVNTAQTPEQLMDMLAKAAPETAELLKQLGQVIKQKYQQWKSALGAQELEFVNKLELLLQQKYNELVEKVKQKLDAPTKQQLKDALLAIAGPMMEKLMQIPVVKAQLAVSK